MCMLMSDINVLDDKCVQTITLPAHSVWCSTCLENGDIVAGTRYTFVSDPSFSFTSLSVYSCSGSFLVMGRYAYSRLIQNEWLQKTY